MSEGQWIAALSTVIGTLAATVGGLFAYSRMLNKKLTEAVASASAEKDKLNAEWRAQIDQLHRDHQLRMDQLIAREQEILSATKDTLEALLRQRRHE